VSCVGGYICLLLSLNLGLDLCSEFLLRQDEFLDSAFHSLEYTLVFTYLLVIFGLSRILVLSFSPKTFASPFQPSSSRTMSTISPRSAISDFFTLPMILGFLVVIICAIGLASLIKIGCSKGPKEGQQRTIYV
jgi:hypothetical protein